MNSLLVYAILVGFLGIGISTSVNVSAVKDTDNETVNNNRIPINKTESQERPLPTRGKDVLQATLSFVMKPLGLIECQGADPVKTGQFFEKILGSDVNYNNTDYLCGPTCRGQCVSRPADIGIPPSGYPFGCKCAQQGCDLNGPIGAPMAQPYFKMVCKVDPRCSCIGMGPGKFTGYGCHWINILSGMPITYREKSPIPQGTPGRPPAHLKPFGTPFLPVRWCSCCPRIPILRN